MNIMLDSGAFAIWSQGKEVSFPHYRDYLIENHKDFDYVVNLDSIPGSPFKYPSAEEREASAKLSQKNFLDLQKVGIPKEKLINVFHQGEPFSFLKEMTKQCPFLGLSPANDRTTEEKFSWLVECMKYVCDDKGFPKVKFHGFAVTSQRLMRAFPWFSVDSASALLQAARGGLFIPRMKRDKEFDFSSFFLFHLPIESASDPNLPTRVKEYLKHLNIPEGRYKMFSEEDVDKETTGKHLWKQREGKRSLFEGKDWKGTLLVVEEGIITSVSLRCILNMNTFNKFAETLPKWPWAFQLRKQSGFNL